MLEEDRRYARAIRRLERGRAGLMDPTVYTRLGQVEELLDELHRRDLVHRNSICELEARLKALEDREKGRALYKLGGEQQSGAQAEPDAMQPGFIEALRSCYPKEWIDKYVEALGQPPEALYGLGEMIVTKELLEVEVGCTKEGLTKPYVVQALHGAYEEVDPMRNPRWQGSVVLMKGEAEGLDRQGFRELLRRKLQGLGDELLAAWEAERDER